MFVDIVLVFILLTLLWIAISLQVITSSLRLIGRLIRRPTRALRMTKKDVHVPIVKLVAVKVASVMLIRYISKKLR